MTTVTTTTKTSRTTVRTKRTVPATTVTVAAAAARVTSALEAGGVEKGVLEFHKQLQTIGKAGGGNFVNQVGVPFINALIKKGSKTRALRTVDIMRQKFDPLESSPLDLQLNSMTKACK